MRYKRLLIDMKAQDSSEGLAIHAEGSTCDAARVLREQKRDQLSYLLSF